MSGDEGAIASWDTLGVSDDKTAGGKEEEVEEEGADGSGCEKGWTLETIEEERAEELEQDDALDKAVDEEAGDEKEEDANGTTGLEAGIRGEPDDDTGAEEWEGTAEEAGVEIRKEEPEEEGEIDDGKMVEGAHEDAPLQFEEEETHNIEDEVGEEESGDDD